MERTPEQNKIHNMAPVELVSAFRKPNEHKLNMLNLEFEITRRLNLANALKFILADLKTQTTGFDSEHEIGYHEGKIAMLEELLEE